MCPSANIGLRSSVFKRLANLNFLQWRDVVYRGNGLVEIVKTKWSTIDCQVLQVYHIVECVFCFHNGPAAYLLRGALVEPVLGIFKCLLQASTRSLQYYYSTQLSTYPTNQK